MLRHIRNIRDILSPGMLLIVLALAVLVPLLVLIGG